MIQNRLRKFELVYSWDFNRTIFQAMFPYFPINRRNLDSEYIIKIQKNPAVTHLWNKTDTQSSRRPDREILETDLITNISKASLITHFHIISIKFGFEYFCTVPVHFFGLRLYIHMVYITVSTSVNIRRMFSMTPTTLTASSQGRWHENEGFWRKTVPSVIVGCHFFLLCSDLELQGPGERRLGEAGDRWMGFGGVARR